MSPLRRASAFPQKTDRRRMAGIGLTAAQSVLDAPQFGAQAQALRPLSSLQEGPVRLG